MITLSSDFGWPYPAAMRGVIASRSDARLVDITHDFPRGDVYTSAFWLREILPWFPPSVHLVVIDPGVGTDRAVLAIEAGEHILVGPDNGVLLPAAKALSDDPRAFALESIEAESSTFHGRDVFAPLAARIHEWEAPLDTVPEMRSMDAVAEIEFPDPTITDEDALGEVLVVDGFGNAITNVPGEFLAEQMGEHIGVDGRSTPVARTYAAVDTGEPLVTVGSHGNVELAVRDGRGAAAFEVEKGSSIRLHR